MNMWVEYIYKCSLLIPNLTQRQDWTACNNLNLKVIIVYNTHRTTFMIVLVTLSSKLYNNFSSCLSWKDTILKMCVDLIRRFVFHSFKLFSKHWNIIGLKLSGGIVSAKITRKKCYHSTNAFHKPDKNLDYCYKTLQTSHSCQ